MLKYTWINQGKMKKMKKKSKCDDELMNNRQKIGRAHV